ncbi:hypothetical protein SSYRP_v1c07630 [Spiroplasma syrphidicola EA-1]|uniref:Transmembrane protein n=1 Tax=Spiroplasma syrphidicola EA-1 TaxID=1276229 RepID=R4U6U7_9MOLU|nr:hypothetical protein [Spiroplasma syrphidicola]AGM26353.1 hypothetical protein SSYRP_v1c07630 [Spiroplasma syrphidicola EA-1]
MANQKEVTFFKIILFILFLPLLYLWYFLAWPAGYFYAKYRSTKQLTDKLEQGGKEWFIIVLLIILWILFSWLIAIFFLCYTLVGYLKARQSLDNMIKGLFGLAWIINFFEKIISDKIK